MNLNPSARVAMSQVQLLFFAYHCLAPKSLTRGTAHCWRIAVFWICQQYERRRVANQFFSILQVQSVFVLSDYFNVASESLCSCVFDFSNYAVCVGEGRPCSKSQTPSVQGQRREVVVQDPIVPLENTCRGINGDTLDRLRVHMFIELLRAHGGFYNPQRSDLDPAVVFSSGTLLQHRSLADEFVESCRMTRIVSTAPQMREAAGDQRRDDTRGTLIQRHWQEQANRENDFQKARQLHQHQQHIQHQQQQPEQQQDQDSSKGSKKWTNAESVFLWYSEPPLFVSAHDLGTLNTTPPLLSRSIISRHRPETERDWHQAEEWYVACFSVLLAGYLQNFVSFKPQLFTLATCTMNLDLPVSVLVPCLRSVRRPTRSLAS